MHAGLRTKLRPALADDVIEMLAPLERGDFSRQSDVEAVRADISRLDGDIARLEGRIGERIGRVEGRIGELAGEIRALESKLDGRIGELSGRIDAQAGRLLSIFLPVMIALVGLVFAVAFSFARL